MFKQYEAHNVILNGEERKVNNMYGLIISGHGKFASGLKSNIELISGEKENIIAIDFDGTKSLEELENDMLNAVQSLQNYKKIIFLVDLKGGSPFNVSYKVQKSNDNIYLFAGVNVPTVLELSMMNEEKTENDLFIHLTNSDLGIVNTNTSIIYSEEDEI